MNYRPRFSRGEWKVECDDCGFVYKSLELKKRWDGLRVCSQCWEERQPQEFVRAKVDIQVPPWTRPELADVFIVVPGSAGTDTWGDSWGQSWGLSWKIK